MSTSDDFEQFRREAMAELDAISRAHGIPVEEPPARPSRFGFGTAYFTLPAIDGHLDPPPGPSRIDRAEVEACLRRRRADGEGSDASRVEAHSR